MSSGLSYLKNYFLLFPWASQYFPHILWLPNFFKKQSIFLFSLCCHPYILFKILSTPIYLLSQLYLISLINPFQIHFSPSLSYSSFCLHCLIWAIFWWFSNQYFIGSSFSSHSLNKCFFTVFYPKPSLLTLLYSFPSEKVIHLHIFSSHL